MNAILLPEIGWYRVDPRGNRAGVNAQFIPPQEQLAFEIRSAQESDFPDIFAEPLPLVLDVLQRSNTWQDVLINLPDVAPDLWQEYYLVYNNE